jgi:hypothetical protein
MPQTDPVHFLVPRKLTDRELAQAVRLDLESELDAINLYESHLQATDNELARRVLGHIAAEEREHAELFRELLKRLDPQLAEKSAAAPEQLRLMEAGADDEAIEEAGRSAGAGGGKTGGEGSGDDAAGGDGAARDGSGDGAAPETASRGVFTVGPLRGSPQS